MSQIFFASSHSIVDFSNGASVATLDVLQGIKIDNFLRPECRELNAQTLPSEHFVAS